MTSNDTDVLTLIKQVLRMPCMAEGLQKIAITNFGAQFKGNSSERTILPPNVTVIVLKEKVTPETVYFFKSPIKR